MRGSARLTALRLAAEAGGRGQAQDKPAARTSMSAVTGLMSGLVAQTKNNQNQNQNQNHGRFDNSQQSLNRANRHIFPMFASF